MKREKITISVKVEADIFNKDYSIRKNLLYPFLDKKEQERINEIFKEISLDKDYACSTQIEFADLELSIFLDSQNNYISITNNDGIEIPTSVYIEDKIQEKLEQKGE